jgi:predicted nucleic acid-binding protein
VSYLLDTSVWSRLNKPTMREAFERLTRSGRVSICRPVMLEILRATRTADFDDVAASLNAHPVVRVHDGTYLRAFEVQRQLALWSQHRGVSTTDLLVAAAAEDVDAIVVHYDGDFETIAAVTAQATQWIVPAGTAD